MRFEFPWAFLILPLFAVLVWFSMRKCHGPGIRFSSVQIAASSGESLKTRFRFLPLFVRGAAVLLLVVGLARPQQGREEIRDVHDGIAIEMVVDRSGSMGQELIYERSQQNRLEAVKNIFREFILGNGKDLQGRPHDLIGMVAFARTAETICPLTLSHGVLDRFIDAVQLVTRRNEDGTAIGDALTLAAARLKTAEEQVKSNRGKASLQEPQKPPENAPSPAWATGADAGYHIKSKVAILLTDGRNNAGKRSPLEAARLAKEWGIKVYAIGIGGRESFVTVKTPFGNYKMPGTDPGVDEATLKGIAETTGGAFWLAESAEKLHEIYREIDKLERTEIESVRHIDYAEKFMPFVLAALALLTLEQVLVSTVFRRIP